MGNEINLIQVKQFIFRPPFGVVFFNFIYLCKQINFQNVIRGQRAYQEIWEANSTE